MEKDDAESVETYGQGGDIRTGGGGVAGLGSQRVQTSG